MGYIHDIEQVLTERLSDLAEERQNEVIQFVKERVLESYKNGIEAGEKGKTGQRSNRKDRRFARRT